MAGVLNYFLRHAIKSQRQFKDTCLRAKWTPLPYAFLCLVKLSKGQTRMVLGAGFGPRAAIWEGLRYGHNLLLISSRWNTAVALTLESGTGMCRCRDPFFQACRRSLNLPSMRRSCAPPPFKLLENFAFSTLFWLELNSALKTRKFSNVRSQYPHFFKEKSFS